MRLFPWLCLILIASLAGCADTKYRSDAMPPLAAGQARIVFFRNTSFVGANLQTGILYDGGTVGNSRPGTYFYIDTTPGTHDISTVNDTSSHLPLTLEAGETRYVKTGLGLGQLAGRIEPESVSIDRALRELPELTFAPSGPTAVPGKPGAAQAEPAMEPEPAMPPSARAPGPEAGPTPVPDSAPNAASEPPAENRSGQIRLGTSSNSVEEMALRERHCEALHGAELVSSDGPVEYYREQCRDGRVIRAKCQYRQCIDIDSD
ncbi:MAG TPA: DUF2846 domain-containing protein [Burkholderiaceae bacterium]